MMVNFITKGTMSKLDDIATKIAAVPMDVIRIAVLEETIEVFKSRIESTETGYLHTTIGTLKHRIEELEETIRK
jgi:hypothetical protein